MRLLLVILSIIAAILGLALSILPFGAIALIPIIAAFIFGLLAFRMSKGKNTNIIKGVFFVTIVALGISIYRTVFEENVVENDVETIEKEKQSEEDAIKELDELEIEEE